MVLDLRACVRQYTCSIQGAPKTKCRQNCCGCCADGRGVFTKRNEIIYFEFLADKPQNATAPFLARALDDACKQGLF